MSPFNPNPEYIEVEVDVGENDREVVIALLSRLPLISIWEDGNCLKAYFEEKDWTENVVQTINDLAEGFGLNYSWRRPEKVNWNAKWESEFNPVEVDRFCRIRALFHEADDSFEHEVIIQPKMAFGTGHHATTYLMIESMAEMGIGNLDVLDFGCGTGILAVLCVKMGAKTVQGIDIEEEAVANAYENASLNGIDSIPFVQGDVTSVKSKFDLILANVNRQVLSRDLSRLRSFLNPGGAILISGILEEDVDLMTTVVERSKMKIQSVKTRDGWVCMLCR